MNIHRIAGSVRWTFFEKNSRYFRGLTLMVFVIVFVLEKYVSSGRHFESPFALVMVLAGMSLLNIFGQAAISFAAVVAITYLSPFGPPNPVFYIMQWFSHFIICFVINYLIKIQIQEHRNTMNFVKTLARTIESKDTYTASHSMNVAKYARLIAERLNYSERECETIFVGALLHDIGKIGIEDKILNKPSKLTREEYTAIQQHPVMGSNMLRLIENFKENKILEMILYHHERFDGSGYPLRLKGNDIPECAAIIAVADAFDAMTSKRIYRESYNLAYAVNELRKNSGTQFDPVIARVFINYIEEHNGFVEKNLSPNLINDRKTG